MPEGFEGELHVPIDRLIRLNMEYIILMYNFTYEQH